jgi:hypothetical protein
MGVNKRKRRAAKQRKWARERADQRSRQGGANPFEADPGWDSGAAYGFVELQVTSTIRRLVRRRVDGAELVVLAESLRRRVQPHSGHVLETVLADVLHRLLSNIVDGGWGPDDLVQLVRRNADERCVSTLQMLLDRDAHLRLGTPQVLVSGLRVAALLSSAPRLEASDLIDATAADASAEEHPKLAQVRALLAKAESTDYDHEADALSAKAQELITKYALEQLVEDTGGSGRSDLRVQRLWIDAPYVGAKAALVHEVARANQCRSASAEHLGFCILVGSAASLHAVELLVTSLLVQANTAMLRHGRRSDGVGGSRTRSFRRSFLLAYAVRIGERLHEAADTVTAGQSNDLLPVLRDHEEQVAAAFAASLPNTALKETTFSNPEGWVAGVVAADLALLDVNSKLTDRAG